MSIWPAHAHYLSVISAVEIVLGLYFYLSTYCRSLLPVNELAMAHSQNSATHELVKAIGRGISEGLRSCGLSVDEDEVHWFVKHYYGDTAVADPGGAGGRALPF